MAPTTRRFLSASSIAVVGLLIIPSWATAQLHLSAGYGFTHRQNERPRRTGSDFGNAQIDNPGEAQTIWFRGGYWFAEKLAVEASATYMWDTSFGGGGLTPLPELQVNTTYLDGRIVYSPFGHQGGLGLNLGIGPSLILHGGSGSSELSRQTDVGLSFLGAVRVRVTGGLGILADTQLHWYTARFTTANTSTDVSETQRDWTFSLGVGWQW